jgi:clan AA aspartic protease
MIRGVVTHENQAVIRIVVLGNKVPSREYEGIVDTGFNGSLSLPSSEIFQLRLPFVGRAQSELADGRKRFFEMFEAAILWDGEEHLINVHQADAEPLLGMALLSGYQLKIDVEREGAVTIQRLVELTS